MFNIFKKKPKVDKFEPRYHIIDLATVLIHLENGAEYTETIKTPIMNTDSNNFTLLDLYLEDKIKNLITNRTTHRVGDVFYNIKIDKIKILEIKYR